MSAKDQDAGLVEAALSPDVESFYHLGGCYLLGKYCNGTGCFVARHLYPERWTEADHQSPRIYCMGQCFQGPAALGAPGRPHMESRSLHPVVLERLLKGGARTLATYQLMGGYQAFDASLGKAPEELLRTIEDSALRGRGGAGFPTGRKWRAAASQPAMEKFIIANGDEGDAGAYIDRFLLEEDPHAIIEGMLIAALAVSATKGWIYLRNEYPAAASSMANALAEARQAGLLGRNALGAGRGFDIELGTGKGSYVCGEETALIHALEGRRPEVKTRPPFATESGLFGRPTVVNNIETLVNVPWIITHGAGNFRFMGFSRSHGTKVLSLNSLFRKPGLYEVEFGIPIRSVVEDLGGGLRDGAALKGVIVGGPLAGIIPPHLLDAPLGYEELRAIGASVGHGGVIGFDAHTSIVQLLRHVFSFAAYESCGKCTPCRIGAARIERILNDIVSRKNAPPGSRLECQRVIEALKLTSLCGLGMGLAELAESALRHYQKELEPCMN